MTLQHREDFFNNVGVLINGNCLDHIEKLTYDYIITSPPDFDEIGEDPNKSTVLWEQLMQQIQSRSLRYWYQLHQLRTKLFGTTLIQVLLHAPMKLLKPSLLR